MADRNGALARPVWMIQAEEAKLKSEAKKAAAAKAAFEATFMDVDKNKEHALSSDSEAEEGWAKKPIGPVDPSKCSAAGAGIAGGAACAPSTFIITTKDSDGRKVPSGGAIIKVKVSPGVGVGGSEIDGIVKDQGDGMYSATYVVPKRGNYMVHVECNGKPIMGSPFPVFFSAGNSTGGLLGLAPATTFPNMANPNMPNMPNYSGSVSGAFPGLLGMIPGLVSGASGGVTLPGIGASLGEVCRDYLSGRCFKTDCKLNHPPHNMLMTAIATTTYSMGSLPQVPMAPSAAAMAAAQAIMAAQALQAHAAQVQAQCQPSKDSSGSSEKEGKGDALKRAVQVSNLSPLLTTEQIKQLFGFCGTVVECTIADSKHFAYIEYSKPEEASAALALNNMDVGGRPLNVEMAKLLPQKPAVPSSSLPSSSLPIMMQQAVAVQQMQFQQALLMQQTMNAQQAAKRAATMKSATELASARAAEISKKLNAEGISNNAEESERKSRSPPPAHARSKSRSRSPVSHHRRHRSHSRSLSPSSRHSRDHKSRSPIRSRRRSRSFSPPARHSRHHRSRSPTRSRQYSSYVYDYERRSYRDPRDSSDRSRRDSHSLRDYRLSVTRRNRSRSISPQDRRSHRKWSESPKYRHHKSSTCRSRSPGHNRDRGQRLSPRNGDDNKDKHINQSRSPSVDDKHVSIGKKDESKDKGKHHGQRRSRSSSAGSRGHKRGKLSPRDSDQSRSKHHRRSGSRSLDDNYLLKDRDCPSRHEDSSHGKRRRSRSADAIDHEIELTNKSGETKSKDEKHASPKYVELGHESGGGKDRSRHGRRKDCHGRRHSRSVSMEDEHDMRGRSSRSKSNKTKHKRKRHSRSRSAEDRYRSYDGIDRSKSRKSSWDARKAAKYDNAIEDSEKPSRNSTESDGGGTSLDEFHLKRPFPNGIELTKSELDKDDLDVSVATDTVFPGNSLKKSKKLFIEHSNHGEAIISGENQKGFEDED